ncbi:8-amino-7-oxononanoate synthase [Marinospirillum celere]|uniref:8-amino-7-oxononanoate synthase n=1 Tax=Marinospirillum celere TaxID=1122252 RepID=A0A1I1DZQ2_9GAMM|nr:8-amino-7-oxononanoate synthase [Marinospirillum celere]SFB79872.1 8-amino-7-oxononanoate synthase [Marinospirillum celere]
MPSLADLKQALDLRREEQLWRKAPLLESAQGVLIQLEGQEVINFCSNDYLGLAADPRLEEALIQGARRWGTGSGASHQVCGHQSPHQQLEEELAKLTGRQAALTFSSGYLANLAAVQTFVGRGDQVFQDRLNHASLLDAGLASGAASRRFQHRDYQQLEGLLKAPTKGRRLLVSDGVFSMDGDQADIQQLVTLAEKHQAWLLIDDAHGLGVLGEAGGGLVGQQFSSEQVPLLTGTLGKALGSAGAFIAGDQLVIDYLRQFARQYIYTTAQPAAQACVTLRALRVLQEEPERRRQVFNNIAYFRDQALAAGLPLMASTTPIQPLLLETNERALHWSQALKAQGLLVMAIRPPTVPKGSARLRITLSAGHSRQQIDQLLEALLALQASESQGVSLG